MTMVSPLRDMACGERDDGGERRNILRAIGDGRKAARPARRPYSTGAVPAAEQGQRSRPKSHRGEMLGGCSYGGLSSLARNFQDAVLAGRPYTT